MTAGSARSVDDTRDDVAVELVRSDLGGAGIRRRRCGRGFRYFDGDAVAIENPETLARIKALLRRAGMENTAPLAAGRITLDIEEHTVQIGQSEPVRLTKLELRLLQMLALHRRPPLMLACCYVTWRPAQQACLRPATRQRWWRA